MNTKKIALYIGSRANYSSALPLLLEFEKSSLLETSVYLAGAAVLPRFGDLRETLKNDFRVADVQAHTIIEGETPASMAKSIGLSTIEATSALERLAPDIAFAIGDRFDVLPWVVAAAALNITVAHSMGGERSGTIDEGIRHAISKLSHIHFVANEDSRNRLIRMGEDPTSVYSVGCPRIDYVASKLLEPPPSLDNFFHRYGGVGSDFNLFDKPFILCLFHPVTTEYGSNKAHVTALLYALKRLGMNTIMIWPNADAGSDEISKAIRTFREEHAPEWLHLFINLPLDPFIHLMDKCAVMVGNSSSAIREASFIGVPVVNIGSRQNMRIRSKNVLDVETDSDAIINGIEKQLAAGKYQRDDLYGDGQASKRIRQVLEFANILSTQKVNQY